MALVGNILSLRSMLLHFDFENKSQVYCKREQVSYHPTISHIPIT
jgi:hypothetical protein